jgi:aspartyl aminopeptidase
VDRNVSEGFKFNTETEFVPIAGLVEAQLNAPDNATPESTDAGSKIGTNHHSALLSLLANELDVSADEIHDFELCVPTMRP